LVGKTTLAAVAAAVIVAALLATFFAGGMLGGTTGLREGKVVRIVSMKNSYLPPEGWKMGDPPLISDRYFNPSRVTIKVGDTVEYVNEDETPHTFTTMRGKAPEQFDSGPVNPNASWRYTFRTAGEYNVYCTLHPHKGVIITVNP